MEPDITISIVSYNTRSHLEACLAALYRHTDDATVQVIVVDNASADGSAEMVRSRFPAVELIANAKNVYFARAHNQALQRARGKYFLILNSDAELQAGTLSRLCRELDADPSIGAVSCQERAPDRTVQATGALFRTPTIEFARELRARTGWAAARTRRHHLDGWDRLSDRDVDVVTDCLLMVRTDLFSAERGYDDRMLLYFTEDDVCRRIWRAGKRVRFVADAHYIHHKHRSTATRPAAEMREIFDRDRRSYYRRHYGGATALVVHLMVRFARLLRRMP